MILINWLLLFSFGWNDSKWVIAFAFFPLELQWEYILQIHGTKIRFHSWSAFLVGQIFTKTFFYYCPNILMQSLCIGDRCHCHTRGFGNYSSTYFGQNSFNFQVIYIKVFINIYWIKKYLSLYIFLLCMKIKRSVHLRTNNKSNNGKWKEG